MIGNAKLEQFNVQTSRSDDSFRSDDTRIIIPPQQTESLHLQATEEAGTRVAYGNQHYLLRNEQGGDKATITLSIRRS